MTASSSSTTRFTEEEEGDILHLAQFLTVYHDAFSAEQWRPISPEDLRRVFALRRSRTTGVLKDTSSSETLENNENDAEIDAKGLEEVDQLLLRMQVWMCKALVQHLLVLPPKQSIQGANQTTTQQQDSQGFWSPILSLPTALYGRDILPRCKSVGPPKALLPFAKIFDTVYNHDVSTNENENRGMENVPGSLSSSQPSSYSLLTPPNERTWRAFAPLCTMISQLAATSPQRALEAVQATPLSAITRRDNYKYTIRHTTSPNYDFHGADLVALWIRAQRNPQAWRHLYQLFQVVPEAVPLQNDARDDGEIPPTQQQQSSYRATLRGNHRFTHDRAVLCTPKAEQLTLWAIINQVSCTGPAVVATIKARAARDEAARRKQKKRPWGIDVVEKISGPPDTKRARLGQEEATTLQDMANNETALAKPSSVVVEQELAKASVSFLLRTWSRRHRPVLQLLLVKPAKTGPVLAPRDSAHLHPRLKQALDKSSSIFDMLKTKMDRNLIHLDRSIRRGIFFKEDDGKGAALVKLSVDDLLQVVKKFYMEQRPQDDKQEAGQGPAEEEMGEEETTDEDDEFVTSLRLANDDFESVVDAWMAIYTTSGIMAAAQSLLELSPAELQNKIAPRAETDGEPATSCDNDPCDALLRILWSTPAPWMDQTVRPLSSVKGESESRCCACCEKWFYVEDGSQKDGDNRTGINDMCVRNLITSWAPLKDVFASTLPSDCHIPDYRGLREDEVSWTPKVIRIRRKRNQAGRPDPYGLGLRQTEGVSQRLDSILSGDTMVWDVFENSYPLAIKPVGLLVDRTVEEFCGARSGLQVGDVVVSAGVSHRDINIVDEDVKFATNQTYQLAKLNSSDRYGLFQDETISELKLVVQRPSRPIVREGKALNAAIRKADEAARRAVESLETVWFCQNCSGESNPRLPLASHPIHRQAQCCKALIRRLGCEAYSDAFLYEDHVDPTAVAKLSDDDADAQDIAVLHSQCVSLRRLDLIMNFLMQYDETRSGTCAAFYVRTRRLHWIPPEMEKNPLAILCRGVHLLAKRTTGSHLPTIAQREMILSDFARFFSAWCLPMPEEKLSLVGPYHQALFALDPAKGPWCSCCSVRRMPNGSKSHCAVCDCFTLETGAVPQPVDSILARYQVRSSLVGRSILVLPGDAILEEMTRKIRKENLVVEHKDRPFEFLVASYLPIGLFDSNDKRGDDSGVYHLLPLVHANQLQYLCNRCQLRGPVGEVDDTILKRWEADKLLDLRGVVKVCFKDLKKCLESTSRITACITTEVARRARCQNFECQTKESQSSAVSSIGDDNEIHASSSLLDAAFESASPVVVEMLGNARDGDLPAGSEDVDNQLMTTDTDKWFLPTMEKAGDGISALWTPPVEQSRYKVLYSDLFFESLEQQTSFAKEIPLELRETNGEKWQKRVIVLSPSFTTTKDNAISPSGWGFELLELMSDPGIARVGRIKTGSIAFSSGLVQGDVVELLNGISPFSFESEFDRACAMLGNSFMNVTRTTNQVQRTHFTRGLLSLGKGRTPTPLVLTIARPPEKSADGQGISLCSDESFKAWADVIDVDALFESDVEVANVQTNTDSSNTIPRGTVGTQSQVEITSDVCANDIILDGSPRIRSPLMLGRMEQIINQGYAAASEEAKAGLISDLVNQAKACCTRFLRTATAEERISLRVANGAKAYVVLSLNDTYTTMRQALEAELQKRASAYIDVRTHTDLPSTIPHGAVATSAHLEKITSDVRVNDVVLDKDGSLRTISLWIWNRIGEIIDQDYAMVSEETKYGLITNLVKHAKEYGVRFLRTATAEERISSRVPTEAKAFVPLSLTSTYSALRQAFEAELQRRASAYSQRNSQPLDYSPTGTAYQGPTHHYHSQQATEPEPEVYRSTDFIPIMNKFDLTVFLSVPLLTPSRLNMPGPTGTILTMAEASVLFYAVSVAQPMAGFRLLSPRYSPFILKQQLQALSRVRASDVPRLPKQLWDELLRWDYKKRHQNEPKTSPLLFQDLNVPYKGNIAEFRYRRPTAPFPIDLYADLFFRGDTSWEPWGGAAVPRIRGGGEPDSGPIRVLADISPSEWNGKAVWFKYKTSTETKDKSKAYGRVQHEVCDDEIVVTVEVLVLYLEAIGPVDQAFVQKLKPKKLNIILPGSDQENDLLQSEDIMRSRKQNDNSTEDDSKEADEGMRSSAEDTQSDGLGERDGDLHGGNAGESRTTPETEGSTFIRTLCTEQKFASASIGHLPDGSPVYWFASDQIALYVARSAVLDAHNDVGKRALVQLANYYSSKVKKNLTHHDALRPPADGKYGCFWGCNSLANDGVRECVAFASPAELRDHLQKQHSLCSDALQSSRVTYMGERLCRVTNFASLREIMYGLSSAICSRCPALLSYTVTDESDTQSTPKKIQFSRSPLESRVRFRGQLLLSTEAQKSMAEAIADDSLPQRSMTLLPLRLSRIFKVDDDWGLKITNTDLQSVFSLEDGNGKTKTDFPSGCNLGCEKILYTRDGSYRETGCEPVGDLCFGDCPKVDDECNEYSPLEETKSFLLALTAKIPGAIRGLELQKIQDADSLQVFRCKLGLSLWNDGAMSDWRSFVSNCQEVASLVQAYVALVCSVDWRFFPDWWKNEGTGWSPMKLLAGRALVSDLVLHMYIFELALTESISKAASQNLDHVVPDKTYVPANLSGRSYEEQVTITLARAQKMKVPLFTGDYQSFCSICDDDDGGDVLCCELCPNVGHSSCYGLDEDPPEFVCHSCINDLDTLQSYLI